MKVTDALLGEHGALKAQFEHMERSLTGKTRLDSIQELASLLESALASHATIENELLFPELERRMGPEGPLAVMRSEHDEIEATLSNIGKAEDPEKAVRLLKHALQVAREHFQKEEEILFPMALRALGEDELERLSVEWSGRRHVRID